MPAKPLDIIGVNDHELLDEIHRARDLAMAQGTLSTKEKLLIALALDASHGAEAGVQSLAKQALQQGATKAEIMETLRVVNWISGAGPMYTAAAALQGIW